MLMVKEFLMGLIDRTLTSLYTKYRMIHLKQEGLSNHHLSKDLTPTGIILSCYGWAVVGLIDTAVKTSHKPGYIQRRLIKGMEDICQNSL